MDELTSFDESFLLHPTDIKQWLYCPRVFYYRIHVPNIRPLTHKMEFGKEAGIKEAEREARRSLRTYGLSAGRREFDIPVVSQKLGLRGIVDMAIWKEHPRREVIPVDYKLSRKASSHFKLQLMAYALMLEEKTGYLSERGFLYLIPLRRAIEVRFSNKLRKQVLTSLDAMWKIIQTETFPAPVSQRSKCVACEFRRFCNDVF
jgi:CRISPR-associated exonuclease Cas4